MGMGTERKRKVSLFDVVDDTSVAAKIIKSNGGAVLGNGNTTAVPLVNRWNGRPYTQRFYDILEKRKTLPVWHQKEEFLQALKNNQTLILVGETGSGKTTQVSSLPPIRVFFGVFFLLYIWFHLLVSLSVTC